MNRRSFLGNLTAFGLAAAVPWLPGCAARKAPRQATFFAPRQAAILRLASLAPSCRNTQPWTVRLDSPSRWIIGLDSGRLIPAIDPENVKALLALGCFGEYLTIAAASQGLRAEIEPVDATGRALAVTLVPGASPSLPTALIEARRTVRKNFRSKALHCRDFTALASPLPGRLFHFPRGSGHAECIREAVVETFRAQTMRDDAQAELARWMRFSESEALARRDGLTPISLELSGLSGLYARLFLTPEDTLSFSFRNSSMETTAALASEGAGWLIVTAPSKDPADILDTGRRFGRLCLLARERMIALHPMNQPLDEPSGLQLIAANHKGLVPLLILRVGYLSAFPARASLRREPAEFVSPAVP